MQQAHELYRLYSKFY